LAGVKTCDALGTSWGPCIGQILPAPDACGTTANENCDAFANEGCASWVKSMSGPGIKSAALTVNQKYLDQVYLAGSFSQSLAIQNGPTFTSPPHRGYFAKFDKAGTVLWTKLFTGTSLSSVCLSVTQGDFGNTSAVVAGSSHDPIDLGGGVLPTFPGNTGNDVVMARFEEDGTHVWSKRFRGSHGTTYLADVGGPVTSTAVLGGANGDVDFGVGAVTPVGPRDVFVAVVNGSGTALWAKRFGAPGFYPNGVAMSRGSNVVIAADTVGGTIDFEGGPLTSQGVLAAYSPTGNHVFSKAASSTGNFVIGDVLSIQTDIWVIGRASDTVDLGGGPLVASSGSGLEGIALAKLDAAGNHVWSKLYAGGKGHPRVVSVLPSGDLILGGMLEGSIDFGGGPLPIAATYTAFVVKLDSSGNHLWSRSYPHPAGVGASFGSSLSPTSQSGFLAVVGIDSPIDLGTGNLNAGDIAIASFGP
jgi:hypothetical protein